MLVKRMYAFVIIYAASIFLFHNQLSELKLKIRLNERLYLEKERYLVFENKTMMNLSKPLTKDKVEILHGHDFQKSTRRFLLFTSAGDKSKVNQWLGRKRNYDIVVVYYGNMTFQLDVDELYIRKDTKFPNLKWYMQTHSIAKYSAIAVWDDDIVASVENINSLFMQMLKTDAEIFSPCHTIGAYPELLRVNKEGVRDVNFIEMNAPMFLPLTLNDFIVQFDPIIKGWGTDIWYSYRCNHILDGCIMKVSDTTCVTNPKTRKDGTREISKVNSDITRQQIWKTFARDILHQSSDVPVQNHRYVKIKPFRNTIGWNQFCKQYLKNNLTFAKYADKVGVKKIVREYNLNIRIPKTYATVTNARDITLKMIQSLPNKYIFKANHGAYMTVIVKNNSFTCHGFCGQWKYSGTSTKLQVDFLRINCRKWLSIDFGKIHGERHYSEIHRQCFFEEMISENNDYKIHTFHGKPAMVEVYTNRFKGHFKAFYTPSWRKIAMNKTIPEPTTDVKKPIVLREMLGVAKQLSRGLSFVRVDLYVNEQTVVFSELTMSPAACRTTYTPPIVDKFYGLLATGGNKNPESIISLLNEIQYDAKKLKQ